MEEVGFFGGSFDPVHFGHINLALQLLEKCKLKEIIFCPANVSPFKKDNPPIAAKEHRQKMLQIALKGLDKFSITDLEIKNEGVSYTIDTLRELNQTGLRLIITEDTLLHFDKWKEYEKIIKIAPPLVGVRYNFNIANNILNFPRQSFVRTSIMDISSTKIRDRIKGSLYVHHLAPKEVLDYIYQNKVYQA